MKLLLCSYYMWAKYLKKKINKYECYSLSARVYEITTFWQFYRTQNSVSFKCTQVQDFKWKINYAFAI